MPYEAGRAEFFFTCWTDFFLLIFAFEARPMTPFKQVSLSMVATATPLSEDGILSSYALMGE